MTVTVIGLFLLLLTISCIETHKLINNLIKFKIKRKRISINSKENEQLKVNIQNSINLSNIEKLAKEELEWKN